MSLRPLDLPVSDRAEVMAFAAMSESHVLLMRAGIAFLLAAAVTLSLGPFAINWLRAHFRERIDSASPSLNQLHAAKGRTPTMGGVLLVTAVLVAGLLCTDLADPAVWITLVVVVGFAAIGGADDWIKARTLRRGLTTRQKLAAQSSVAILGAASLRFFLPSDTWAGERLLSDFPAVAAGSILWGAFVIVATSNAVNLADGLDGLASGCGVVASAMMAAVCYMASDATLAVRLGISSSAAATEVTVLIAAQCGALLAFLKFNRFPARVFMGDTGALSMGAMLGVAGIVSRQELLFVVVCGVYVAETVSVILQVGWFKATGRRLIRCSPLHNHLVLSGWREARVVRHFWLASVGCAAIAIAVLWAR